jgi:hypothetical protein
MNSFEVNNLCNHLHAIDQTLTYILMTLALFSAGVLFFIIVSIT